MRLEGMEKEVKFVKFVVFPNIGRAYIVNIVIDEGCDEEQQVDMWIENNLQDTFVDWEWA